jgi:nascent polypeptide-associated complex subunit alpha
MIPGMNPKAMKQAMKKMGMTQVDIDAYEVVIRTQDKELVFKNPQVAKVTMMGQDTYQIVGEPKEVAPRPSKEDVQTVVDQTGRSETEAMEALEKAEGDLAQAIMDLQEQSSQ